MNFSIFNRLHRNPFALLALLSISLQLAGCASPEFASGWRQAKASPPTGIEGAWEGTWRSEGTGHQGKLRCLVSPSAHDPQAYHFKYWASWATVFSGNFDVTYHVTPENGAYAVSGESDLGPFGIFSHQGQVSKDRFHATFRSDKEAGVFEMTRPH
jgi:hypothetical protein